jgi:hypothetical protein
MKPLPIPRFRARTPLPVYASTDPRVKTVPLPGRKVTSSAEAYAQAEERWQAQLRRRTGRRSGRDALDLAKAKARRLQRAYIDGSDPTSMAGYTQDQIDALSHKGQALWMKGRYAWPVVRRRDLVNLLAAWRQLRPGKEASEVKAWLKSRAIGLGLEAELPASWRPPVPTPVGPRA